MAQPHGGVNPEVVAAVRGVVDGHGCLVALGGGADSAVLLAAASEADPAGLRAVFVDHHLDATRALSQAANAVAHAVGVPLLVIDGPVRPGGNLEARAREVRYRAMEDVMSRDEVGLTGHTLDDQAETVLMRLATGSGTSGLGGIPPARGSWRRPLLPFSKAMLRDLADRLQLPYADDSANTDDRFTRSRIRRSVMPVLSEVLGPTTQEGFARSAALMRTDDEVLEALAVGITTRAEDDRVLIPAAPLITADRAIATRVCRRVLRVLLDGRTGGFADVAAILETAATGTTSQLTEGLVATAEGAYVVVGPRHPDQSSTLPPVPVAIGDRFSWQGATYSVAVHDHVPPAVQGGRFTLLDAASLDGGAVVRAVEPGDTMEIEVGSTPVSELLRVHGIPPSLRSVSPAVSVGAKIAAVLGVRTAAWAKPRGMGTCIVIEREVGT